MFETKDIGFHIRNVSNSVLVSGCRTFQIDNDAICVENSHEINISSNIFCWHRGNGIVLRDVTWGSINANNVIDTGVNKQMVGILMENKTKGLQVTGNSIFNWPGHHPMSVAIKEDSSCMNNQIIANNINHCNVDISSEGKGTMVQNNISETKQPYLGKPGSLHEDFIKRDRLESFISEIKKSR